MTDIKYIDVVEWKGLYFPPQKCRGINKYKLEVLKQTTAVSYFPLLDKWQ